MTREQAAEAVVAAVKARRAAQHRYEMMRQGPGYLAEANDVLALKAANEAVRKALADYDAAVAGPLTYRRSAP